MIGAGAARGPAVLNKKEVSRMLQGWLLVTIFSALIGLGVGYLLLRFF
jgi:phosphate/sulfate permease